MSWTPVPFGPEPWHQTSWDVRAAGNFAFGGAGSGLVAFAAVSPAEGVALSALLLAGLALVGLGLGCVFLEIGRPLRAPNVIRNPRTSWMSREAMAAGLLAAAVAGTVAGVPACRWAAAALALVFVYCQARLLQAAKGVPAWREPAVVPFIVATGLAEGAGVFLAAAPWHDAASMPLVAGFGALLIARLAAWLAYRRRVAGTTAPGATAALDRAGRALQLLGTLVPLALALAAGFVVGDAVLAIVGVAGLLAALAGAYAKLLLVTRAAFNQGFALPHVPVRGVRS